MKAKRGGRGYLYHASYKDKNGRICYAKTYSIGWTDAAGVDRRESAHTTNKAEAQTLLDQRRSGIKSIKEQAIAAELGTDRMTVTDLIGLIELDYQRQGYKTFWTIQASREPHLQQHLGDLNLRGLPGPHGEASAQWWNALESKYVKARLKDGAANNSINHELATLHRGLKLAKKAGKIDYVHEFEKLKPGPARQGFLEPEHFVKIMALIDPWWHGLFKVWHVTGWRGDEELATMKRDQLDFNNNYIRLYDSKNSSGRTFPMNDELRAVMMAQIAQVDALAKKKGRKIDCVFPRSHTGLQLTSGYKIWKTAAIKAGFPKSMPHDFRRTAVRNNAAAGIPREINKRMVGHKTDEMFERYNIPDVAEAEVVREKMTAFQKKTAAFLKAKTITPELEFNTP